MKIKKSTVKMMVLAGALVAVVPACKKKGCTDETALNYSEEAKKDDGSCIFPDVDITVVMVTEIIIKCF